MFFNSFLMFFKFFLKNHLLLIFLELDSYKFNRAN
jgi:hypothetical protein